MVRTGIFSGCHVLRVLFAATLASAHLGGMDNRVLSGCGSVDAIIHWAGKAFSFVTVMRS